MTEVGRDPIVRVSDASLIADEGPVRVTVSRLQSPDEVGDALAAAGGRASIADGRLTVVTTPSRLVDAAGRAHGREVAEALEAALSAALGAWREPPPDLELADEPLPCSSRTLVVGVLNVTPDSFSDGGRYYDPGTHPDLAVERGRALVAAGADIVDVGGESTRPGAEPVGVDEESGRVVPVVEALAEGGALVSVDTRKAAVAAAAVDVGAVLVNDVSGGEHDPEMLDAVADRGVGFVVMHMRGSPETMQDDPRYDDVVAEVFEHLVLGVERAVAAGIDPDGIVVDPGIGFGKTVGHNLTLLRDLRDLTSLGRPVLVGASRKSFIGRVGAGTEADDRLPGSIAAAAMSTARGAALVRVHDVAETVAAVRVARAIADGEPVGGDR